MSEKPRALLVDDLPAYSRTIKAYLEINGYEVLDAEDVAGGEALLNVMGSVDLVMVDKGARYAPGKVGYHGGLDFARQAKELFPPALVVVASNENYDDRSVNAELIRCGADVFLDKFAIVERLPLVMQLHRDGKFPLPPKGVFVYWGVHEEKYFLNGQEIRRELAGVSLDDINTWPISN